MAQLREELLYNGTGAGHQVRQSGAFDLQEQTIIIASANLSGPVTIQVLQPVLGMWFDVMVAGKPLQLTPQNTFQLMTIQGAYRIKPGEATGQAVIWFREVSHVPEWNWWAEGGQEGAGGNAGAGGGSITPPVTWTNLDGSIAGRVGQP